MKKRKKLLSIFMALALCLSLPIISDAKETDDGKLRYGEREKVTVLKTEYATTTVTPSGQPTGGTRFPTGGGLYVNTSGGKSVSVGLSVSWGRVNASVSLGKAGTKSSVGGVFLTAPNKKDYFVAKIRKKYKVQYKKVDRYQYNTYLGTNYISVATLYSQEPYLAKK